MKFNKIFISAGIAAAALGMASCTGDLDLMPTDPKSETPDKFANNPMLYMQQVMADVYMQYATYGVNGDNTLSSMDGGMSTFQRSLFNLEEIPTDETNWIPVGDAIDHTFQYGIWTPSTTVIAGAYARLITNVTLCNQFIQTNFSCTTDEEQKMFEEFSRQCRIMRDATYFYLIDLWGNVPWADESVTPGSIAPQLSSNFNEGRRLVFERVTEDLEELVAWYKTNDPNNKPPYGYCGLDLAEAMLVKFYLNAEVYTGTARWKDCYDHAQAIIGRLGKGGFEGSGLTHAYHQNFSYNNKEFAIGGASAINEIIWTIPQENPTNSSTNQGLLSYANGTLMCNGFIGNPDPNKKQVLCSLAEYNSGDGWKCMTARREFTEKFDWNANYTYSPDLRTRWWKTAAHDFDINNGVLDQDHWGDNGFLPVKYTNWYIDDNGNTNEELSPAATDQLGVDYAMVRLAEIYLSAAEAALQGGGDKATALSYVNLIRKRAGLDTYTSINLNELRDERCRELYTECVRRSDLIRYNQWVSGYTWAWKNNTRAGADYPSNWNVYPLPSTVVARNGYVQNPGY